MNVTHNFELCVKLFLQGWMTACMFIDLKKNYWLHKVNLFFGVIFFLIHSFIEFLWQFHSNGERLNMNKKKNPAKTHYIEVINWSACLSDIGISSSPSNQNSGSHRSAVFLCGTQITVNLSFIATKHTWAQNLFLSFQPLHHHWQEQKAVKGCQEQDCRHATGWNGLLDHQQQVW